MLKRRYKILITTDTQVIHLGKYKTMEIARAHAKPWAKEGYGNIIIRREGRRLNDTAHHILLAVLFASPWLIAAWLGW